MPNEPKLHQFLPEAYLRRFADERGDLWVLDRKQGIVRRQSPEVTAAERKLNTFENDFVKMMINLVPMLADAIHRLEWFIASEPPGKAFVTCDAPVIITRPPNRQREDHSAVEPRRAPDGQRGGPANGGAHHDRSRSPAMDQ